MYRSATLTHLCATVLVLTVVCDQSTAQSFEHLAARLSILSPPARTAVVDSFLRAHPSSPVYRDDTVAVFYYCGDARTVAVAGDANGWNPGADRMTHIPGTDLWYLTRVFEPDARLDYKFVIDSSRWILDPKNERTSRGGFGMNSELRMPGTAPSPELVPRGDVPRGSIHDTTVSVPWSDSTRRVRIYTSAVTAASMDPGLLLVHDGPEFLELAGLNVVLDNLIARGTIPPVIAVCVPPVERTREYSGDLLESYSSYLVNDLLPSIRRRYSVSNDPRRSVVMGASNGGNISLFMAMTDPGVFGNVAAFSSNVIPPILTRFASEPILPLRMYLDIGTYDIPQLLPLVRSLRTTVQERGYPLLYAEHHDGHSWANWASHIDDALVYLLSSPRSR